MARQIANVIFAPFILALAFLPDSWFGTEMIRARRAALAEADAWAITEEFSVCSSCGSPVDPGAKRCRGGCRV